MYKEIFKTRLVEYLKDYQLIFHEEEPIEVALKSRAETLAVSAILKFPNETMLHKSILIEGNNQMYSNSKNYAQIFATEIQELIISSAVIDEEHQD